MRYAVALALILISPVARADGQNDTWNDFATQESAIANASTQDCATACKALESLARAARHICDVAPEKCDEAKSRLRAAADRVHAACPQCTAVTQTPSTPPPPTTLTGGAGENVSAQSAPPTRGGGCAGCAVTSSAPDFGTMLFALAAIAIFSRKKKRH